MARAKTTKKATVRISQKVEARIVELSLQNPDFGARRLVPLLKQEKINASASRVYAILKRNGLQNRDARLKTLQGKALKSRPRQSTPAAISPAIEEQIVEISLQNPDFGAKRLLPLLQKSGIETSSSRVYSILKRRGLQTRKLRLAKREELTSANEVSSSEKAASELTPELEERIVDVSLENPEYGARRLAGLMAEDGISISSAAVFALLERHGMQTRSLREQKVELHRLTDDDDPAWIETETPDPVPITETPEDPGQYSEATVDNAPTPRAGAPVPPAPVKSPLRAGWLFYLADVVLLALVGYLGYIGYHAVVNFNQARMTPAAVAAVKPEQSRRAVQPAADATPLKNYQKIWERNLFNIPEKKPPAPKKEIPVENIALAKKDIGLKLVGTIVAHDANFSRAIVHVSKTREQEAFREGDQAGKAKIKKILRNKVVITTAKGDQLLIVEEKDFGKDRRTGSKKRRAPTSLKSQQSASMERRSGYSGDQTSRRRVRSINLKREDVQASLADTDQLLEELTISPFVQDEQPAGFIISKIPRGSILTKMGLRNGYAVTQINDQAITGPDQASEFFRTLAEGGEVSIQVRRSRGVRRRSRQINLNIE